MVIFSKLYNPLSDMLKSYPEEWKNHRRFRSLISDYYPFLKMERNLILACVDEQIPNELAKRNKCSVNELNRFVKIIENSYGYTRDKAIYAVALWLKALGVVTDFDIMEEIADLVEQRLEMVDRLSGIHRQAYSQGYIDYETTNKGIAITNIVYKNPELVPVETMVVIPELISDKKIVSLRPNSLDSLRKAGITKILVPDTVRSIGEKGTRFYEKIEGKQPKTLDIFYSFISYKDLQDNLLDELNSIYGDNYLFGYKFDQSKDYSPMTINLKLFLNNRGYWIFPSDGVWSNKNTFYRYTGLEDTVIVETENVCSFAFYESSVKKIVFSEKACHFEKNMIFGCDNLSSIEFDSYKTCFFSHHSINNCQNLASVKWPDRIDDCRKTIFSRCPLVGDMIHNNSLISCYSLDEIYVVDKSVTTIYDRAFCNSSSQILVIPQSVTTVRRDAFIGSSLKVVIFEDPATEWVASRWSKDDIYLYAAKGSYVFQYSNFRWGCPYDGYVKNINRLEGCLGENRNLQRIKDIIYNNMDQISDDLIQKPDLKYEIETSKKIIDRYNEYTDMFVHPSQDGTQLGENYDVTQYERRKQTYDNYEGNTANTGKYGTGLGNEKKIPL